MKRYLSFILVCLSSTIAYCQNVPFEIKSYIGRIFYESIGFEKPSVTYTTISPDLIKVHLSWDLKKDNQQGDWQVNIRPTFAAATHRASHPSPFQDNKDGRRCSVYYQCYAESGS